MVQRVHSAHLFQDMHTMMDSCGLKPCHDTLGARPTHLLQHSRLLGFVHRLNSIIADSLLLPPLVARRRLPKANLLVNTVYRKYSPRSESAWATPSSDRAFRIVVLQAPCANSPNPAYW